jgi:hypothetical protein
MAKATEKQTVNDALGAAMKRREAKLAAAAAAKAKAEAEAKAKKARESAPKAKPAPQDHRPPTIGAKAVMATFESAMEIVRERRLKNLARKYPEIANLLEAAKPASAAPPSETPAETPEKPAAV